MSNAVRKFQRQNGSPHVTPRERKMLAALQTCSRVLHEYAKGTSWALQDDKAIWIGEGNGPELALKCLGIPQDKKKQSSKWGDNNG